MDYKVHLKQYEGPLDLLLHLVERAEVDISDIFVSEITNQFLEYMDQLDELDMDTASEFIAMAATLVYIKSKSLLPKPVCDEQTDVEDSEQALIKRLQEYKLFKEAGRLLADMRDEAYGAFAKPREEFAIPAPEITWKCSTIDALSEALENLMNKRAYNERIRPLHKIKPDEFSVRLQAKRIRALLCEKDSADFEELFEARASKLEIVVTFMALLEMTNHGEVRFEQEKPYGSIRVYAARLADDDYFDEYDRENEDGYGI